MFQPHKGLFKLKVNTSPQGAYVFKDYYFCLIDMPSDLTVNDQTWCLWSRCNSVSTKLEFRFQPVSFVREARVLTSGRPASPGRSKLRGQVCPCVVPIGSIMMLAPSVYWSLQSGFSTLPGMKEPLNGWPTERRSPGILEERIVILIKWPPKPYKEHSELVAGSKRETVLMCIRVTSYSVPIHSISYTKWRPCKQSSNQTFNDDGDFPQWSKFYRRKNLIHTCTIASKASICLFRLFTDPNHLWFLSLRLLNAAIPGSEVHSRWVNWRQ